MARFLFSVWPFAGHVHPSLAIAHELRRRGNSVAFYSGTSIQRLIESEGFAFFPFEHVDEERIAYLAASEFPFSPSIWHRLRTAKRTQAKFKEWLLDTVPQQLSDLQPLLKSWSPDILVTDLAFWSPILILQESEKIPVAVLSVLAACILPGPDAPAWGQGGARPRGALGRFRSRASQTVLRWLSSGFRADVNAMRGRYGLPPVDCSMTELAGTMPLYLVPSTPEYDYQRRDLPPSVRYVGPCLWDKPSSEPPPTWLHKLPEHGPLVYVTEATIGTTEPFLLRMAYAGLRDRAVDVVMTTGKQRSPSEVIAGEPARNIRVESYVAQSYLLPKMSVMVTLGGSGGVLAALKAGVPLVIVPTEWDRPENAQRVVEAGAGIRISPEQCSPERLRAAVERVLREPSFRQAAQRLAENFAQFGGPADAARLLEELNSSADVQKGASVAAGH